MTPTLFDLALKAGFSDPIEGWMGEGHIRVRVAKLKEQQ